MAFPCANPRCNKEYNNKRFLHLHYQQSPLCNPSSHSFPVGNAGPFGDFDLSDMDLSLTSLCEGSNNLQESLMDISFPLSGDSSCVGSASSSGSSFSGGGGGGSGSGGGSGHGCIKVAPVAALTTALVVEAAVLLLSLLILHLTLIQIQTMNSLMHYLIPIVLNVKLNIWGLNDSGTYAFVILINLKSDEPTIAVCCGGNMPDPAEFIDMDSHHPESAALYAALCFVQELLACFPHGPLTGDLPPLQCCLNNKSVAVNDLEWNFNNINTPVYDFLKADYDILQGILHVINKLPLKATVRWVKGHQDHDTPRLELPVPALANCIADDVCTATYRQHPRNVGRFPDWIPSTKAALLHNGKLVTKAHDDYVTTAATAPQLCQHIIEDSKKRDKFIPNDWSDATFDDVDWKAINSSLKAVSIGRRFQLSKFAHEWTPALHHLAKIDNSIDRRCFACQHLRNFVKEDIDHMLRCTSK